jgi:two-component system cell cycle response regulator
VDSVEILRLNLAIEPDLQNFVGFLMESVRHLKGNAFRASLASLDLNQHLRAAGACKGQLFPVTLHLINQSLRARWGEHELEVAQIAEIDKSGIEQLREHLRKSTEAIDPEILMQRNEAMLKHLNDARTRTERELAELQEKLENRQEELKVSMLRAETDPLTMLPNRRAFDERLSQAFRYTMRQKNAPLSLVMLDLDYFKRINDDNGHLFGDAYLNKMAHILRSVIREDVDCAFRFGGDEFAMMIHADFSTACEKSRQVLLQMDGKVSIGIATIDKNTPADFSFENFIHKADTALYEAKRRGRGRVVVSQCDRLDTQDCDSICTAKESSV